MEPTLLVFAGLGLFFVGVKFIGANLNKMTGRRFHAMMITVTRTAPGTALAGVLSGALIQSSSAVTFIAISLAKAGFLTVRRAILLVSWANVGTSALILLAIIDIHLLVLLLVALTGLCHQLDVDRSARLRHLVGAMLGLSLLFLGLDMMKGGAAPLRDTAAFEYAIAVASSFLPLLVATGAVASLVTQSSATVAVIAVTMAHVGLLTVEQTLLMVYGASIGSGLNVVLLTTGMKGVPQILASAQLWLKLGGVAVMMPAFLLERYAGIPLVVALIEWLSDGLQVQIAWAYLLLQVVSALAMSIAVPFVAPLLVRGAETEEDRHSGQPVFIYDQARDDPPTALDLLRREIGRLIAHLPLTLDDIRPAEERTAGNDPARLREADRAVLDRVDRFVTDLIDRPNARETLNDILLAQHQAQMLADLQAGLAQLVEEVRAVDRDTALGRLTSDIVESLHALLAVLDETVGSADEESREILLKISGDRSELTDRLRRQFLDTGAALEAEQQRALFAVTGLYERLVWIVRNYARTMEFATVPPRAG